MTVTLLPKKDFNEVYGVVSVQVGSVDTRFTVDGNDLQQYPQGIAHFLEHKLFEGERQQRMNQHRLKAREEHVYRQPFLEFA